MTEFIKHMTEYVDALPPFLRCFLIAIFATIEYVFPLFPGDTIVIAAGLFKARGALSFWEIILGLILGTLIGICLTYFAGHMIAKRKNTSFLPSMIISVDDIDKINRWYKKWGYPLLIINRFFPGIRSLFFVAAGMNHMSFFLVLMSGFLSALIFNSLLFFLGYFAGHNIEFIEGFIKQYTIIAYLIIATIITIFLMIFYRRRKKL